MDLIRFRTTDCCCLANFRDQISEGSVRISSDPQEGGEVAISILAKDSDDAANKLGALVSSFATAARSIHPAISAHAEERQNFAPRIKRGRSTLNPCSRKYATAMLAAVCMNRAPQLTRDDEQALCEYRDLSIPHRASCWVCLLRRNSGPSTSRAGVLMRGHSRPHKGPMAAGVAVTNLSHD